MLQGQGPAMALTTVYAKPDVPPRSAPGGCRKLPGPWWYWVLLGAGWVGTAVLAGIVLWLLQQQGGNGPILSQGSYSWETCPTNTSRSNISECECPLRCFRLQLRQRLCEQGSRHATGTSVCRLCPAGWQPFAAKCYWVSTKTGAWEVAAENCSYQQSQLVTLKSVEEKTFVRDMIGNTSRAWLGLSINQTRGKNWTWEDGSPLQEAL
ncbi:C-type lectin domain family 17, member A-like [Haliaeetus albicilla]|uniref:C-type lectin domain family 17, member A-like n=1 Tax=Haliaeetus albicilla TaxID=8969 RepID=UPI0037E839E7